MARATDKITRRTADRHQTAATIKAAIETSYEGLALLDVGERAISDLQQRDAADTATAIGSLMLLIRAAKRNFENVHDVLEAQFSLSPHSADKAV